ncbi:MAG: hypothetical protein JWN20_427, partial [Jatrophihabitantaceae bacterium]|nr:hypothetical protein [Jatrophihabitantaceae bacterium]
LRIWTETRLIVSAQLAPAPAPRGHAKPVRTVVRSPGRPKMQVNSAGSTLLANQCATFAEYRNGTPPSGHGDAGES